MNASYWALLISGFALAISISGFVWSIWKEFIFVKPRVNVSFAVMEIFADASSVTSICSLTATNFGPGPVRLHNCITRKSRGLFRKAQLGSLFPIDGDPRVLPHTSQGPFSGGLPVTLAPGEMKSFYFPYVAECFLKEPPTHVGVSDTYERRHWCKKRHVITARKQYLKDFWVS